MLNILIIPKSAKGAQDSLNLLGEVLSGTKNHSILFVEENQTFQVNCPDSAAELIYKKALSAHIDALFFVNTMQTLN